MAVEEWQKEAAREIRTLKPNYTDARDYAEVIARHYAARDREVQELVRAAAFALLGMAEGAHYSEGIRSAKQLRHALAPFTEKQP